MPMGIKLGMGLPPLSGYALPNGVEPLFVADFKNAVYQIDGANVAITDIFEENTDFGTFSPSDVIADVGLVSSFPVLKPALAAPLLADGYTVVMTAWAAAGAGNNWFYSVDLPDWTQEFYGGLVYDNVEDKYSGYLNTVGGQAFGPKTLVYPSLYRFGATIDGSDVYLSVAGSTVISRPGDLPPSLNAIGVYANNTPIVQEEPDPTLYYPVETWAAYPPQDPESLDELTAP